MILHRYQTSHAINAEKLSFGLNSEENLVMRGAKADSIIYNLHNHAKDLRLYDSNSRKSLLEKRVNSTKLGEHQEFFLRIFALAFFSALTKRITNIIYQKKT